LFGLKGNTGVIISSGLAGRHENQEALQVSRFQACSSDPLRMALVNMNGFPAALMQLLFHIELTTIPALPCGWR
jgi:hypothetical protein